MPDEPSDETEDLFPLFEADRGLIEALVRLVRKLIHREDATPEEIHHLAILLFGLERLPLATAGFAVEMTLSERSENDMSYQGINLDGSSLCLSSGGSMYTPGAGSDTVGEDLLLAEVGGHRSGGSLSPREWIAGFKSRVESDELTINLTTGECDVDWEQKPDESAWERAAKQYGEEESDDD